MPVIINDFEIVHEPPAAAPSGAAPSAPAAEADGARLRPADIERIVAHQQARRLRVYAD
ncbi:MAG: hypothetical protein NZ528_07860 [Caldilineales bacterium]|nr:hypothetical protein [Caldilineales bacterium]MDW8318321.1 hypothetical protein [Anaerolineae bacterium]